MLSKHLEMGQGSLYRPATIVAEELDADWSQIRVEVRAGGRLAYNNLHSVTVQGTGGSSGHRQLLRPATQRRRYRQSIADRGRGEGMGRGPTTIGVEKGVVKHATSGRSATFGELAGKAAGLPVPDPTSR